jgi:hypothetical protein
MVHVLIDNSFGRRLKPGGLLDLDNLIIAGDLNLTTSVGEIWGASATQDTLADFFSNLFSLIIWWTMHQTSDSYLA